MTRCEHDAPVWGCRICCDPLTAWAPAEPNGHATPREPRDWSRIVAVLCLLGMVALALLAGWRR